MAVATMKSTTARVRLENGRDASGMMTYVNQSLGNLKEAAFEAANKAASLQSLMEVVAALEPIFSKDIGEVNLVSTEVITSA